MNPYEAGDGHSTFCKALVAFPVTASIALFGFQITARYKTGEWPYLLPDPDSLGIPLPLDVLTFLLQCLALVSPAIGSAIVIWAFFKKKRRPWRPYAALIFSFLFWFWHFHFSPGNPGVWYLD